ncbi:hypothetical protein ACN4EE_07155 [Geminocystis sp. CENA526]|uniref:hypothetical protein n=1 Tax=Geminocystis sp. CENA526 TaxID=1355871 RepID=UPI003D6E92A1
MPFTVVVFLYGLFTQQPALSSNPPPTVTPSTPTVQVEQKYTPSHTPIRESYQGSCDCPYDFAKNGSICGGRSAYLRPGGYEPICYLDD